MTRKLSLALVCLAGVVTTLLGIREAVAASCWNQTTLNCCTLHPSWYVTCGTAPNIWYCNGDSTSPGTADGPVLTWVLVQLPGYSHIMNSYTATVNCSYYQASCGGFVGTCIYSSTLTTFTCRDYPLYSGTTDCP
jgi:hypothetical protein